MKHAKLSASAAHRWMACAGSPRLTAGIPRTTSRNAAEGTYAHEIAAAALNKVQPAQRWLGKVRVTDGFHIECDQPMIDSVQEYVSAIENESQDGDVTYVETDLTPALRALHEDLGGTADYIRYRPDTKNLRVVDLKFGKGVIVEAEGNLQARVYALGALLTLGRGCSTVTVVIHQPRANHPDGKLREWTFDSGDLIDFSADLQDAAKATEPEDAPLTPGEKQCRWCPAAKEKCDVAVKYQPRRPVEKISPDDFAVVDGTAEVEQ